MRLGEILIEDGAVTASDLAAAVAERALAPNPRLGAILIRRGVIAPDGIARALARQHGVPAALARHLEQRDPAVSACLPDDLALRLTALPLARSRIGDQLAVVVCLRDPRDPVGLELVSRALGEPIIPAVASEAILVPAVHAAYGALARPARVPVIDDSVDVVFDDASGPIVAPDDDAVAHDVILDEPSAPGDPMASGALTLVGLDEAGVARDPSQWQRPGTARPLGGAAPSESLGEAVRHANDARASTASSDLDELAPRTTTDPELVRTLRGPSVTRTPTDPPRARPPTPRPLTAPVTVDDGWRITGEQAAVAPLPDEPAPIAPPPMSRADLATALAAATDRDQVGDAAIAFMSDRYAAAAILIVKDGVALGHRGVGALGAPIDVLVVPLGQPSVVQQVHDRAAPYFGVPGECGPIQERLLRALGARGAGVAVEVAVVPVVIGARMIALAIGHSPRPGVDAAAGLADLSALAEAMSAAYVRVIRRAKRPT